LGGFDNNSSTTSRTRGACRATESWFKLQYGDVGLSTMQVSFLLALDPVAASATDGDLDLCVYAYDDPGNALPDRSYCTNAAGTNAELLGIMLDDANAPERIYVRVKGDTALSANRFTLTVRPDECSGACQDWT
jgi:hypothetical protein